MNKQTLIITLLLGIGIGIFFAYPSHSMPGHMHTSTMMMENVSPVLNYEESLKCYFEVQDALAKDNLENVKHSSQKMMMALGQDSKMIPTVEQLHHAQKMKEARALFETLSHHMEALINTHGIPENMTIMKYHCPMVNHNKGASWLQNHEGTLNPYFGKEMLHCGTKTDTFINE